MAYFLGSQCGRNRTDIRWVGASDVAVTPRKVESPHRELNSDLVPTKDAYCRCTTGAEWTSRESNPNFSPAKGTCSQLHHKPVYQILPRCRLPTNFVRAITLDLLVV